MFTEYLQRLAWDPTAPVPAGWPHGWWGVLLLFCIPGGMGIPPGVLLGHEGGLGAILMSVLYFASDIVLAFVFEPMLIILAVLARRLPLVRRAGDAILTAITRTMPAGSASAPLGIALTAFGAGLPFGRALAAGAGFGLVTSWFFTIAGDMVYFGLGMASTLWFDNLLGDPRTAALAGLAVMFIVPGLIRRWQARQSQS
ncbi:MAG TPA: hypothetical protein VMT89_13835 [Candidatus Acidoferrales bacterium]|nr:hypothetical protein [Candidatus Acidoferrales bacterium]